MNASIDNREVLAVALDVYKDWLGIPEGARPPDHYALLRLVNFEDDVQKVRSNYKKLNALVRKYAIGQYSIESQQLLNELAKAMLCLTDPVRKRSYDESLGRKFEEGIGDSGRKSAGDVLVEQGQISGSQLTEVKTFADKRGLSIRDAVVQMKLVDPTTAAQALAEELGLPFVDLGEMTPDDSVLDKVPRAVVKRNSIMPLFVDEDVLLVACVDEPDPELEEELRLRFELPIRGVIATPLAINQCIAKHYAPGMRDDVAQDVPSPKKGKSAKVAGKQGAAAASPRAARKKSNEPLTDEERNQRKQIGILIICAGITGPIVLNIFVLSKIFHWSNPLINYLPTIVIAPIVIWYVLAVYWKE